jgi:hypothetical protein
MQFGPAWRVVGMLDGLVKNNKDLAIDFALKMTRDSFIAWLEEVDGPMDDPTDDPKPDSWFVFRHNDEMYPWPLDKAQADEFLEANPDGYGVEAVQDARGHYVPDPDTMLRLESEASR